MIIIKLLYLNILYSKKHKIQHEQTKQKKTQKEYLCIANKQLENKKILFESKQKRKVIFRPIDIELNTFIN